MKTFLKNQIFVSVASVVLLFFTLLIYFPALKLNFLLIDDGQIIKNSKIIATSLRNADVYSLQNILFEAEEGRVRPVYWLMQSLVSSISMYNVQAMHLFRLLFLFICLYLVYKILINLKVNLRWIFFSSFLFILNFQNFENFYRLGPTEIFLALFFLVNVNIYTKEIVNKADYYILFLTSLLGCFTKETFFLTAIPTLFFIINKSSRQFKLNKWFYGYVLVINFLIATTVFLIKNSYGVIQGYSQNYKFSINVLIDNLSNYYNQISHYQSPVLAILVIYSLYWIFNNFRNIFKLDSKNDIFFVFFVSQIVLNLAILLPWQFVLGRYLIIVNLSIIFAVAIILENIWKLLPDHKLLTTGNLELLKNVFLILLLPFIFVRNVFPIANFQEWQRTDSDMTTDIVRSLSKHIPQNKNVFVNYKKGDANIEIFLETAWHLEEFHNRTDITFEYLDETNICSVEERYLLDRTSERFIDRDKILLENLELIDGGKYSYDPINYGEVLKSFMYLERLANWSQSYTFEWYLYKQKAKTCIK